MGGDIIRHTELYLDSSFNPRPHMGGDDEGLPVMVGYNKFQSTPPHGGRPNSGAICANLKCFNPRPHMGGDIKTRWITLLGSCFNPRPHMGGDQA